MSELRRRNIADSILAEKRTQINSDATQSALPSTSVVPKTVLIVSCLLVCAFFWLYTLAPPTSLNRYAICSRSGARIYTVEDANPTVQCFVIQDEFIVDTGSLGVFLSSHFCIWTKLMLYQTISPLAGLYRCSEFATSTTSQSWYLD